MLDDGVGRVIMLGAKCDCENARKLKHEPKVGLIPHCKGWGAEASQRAGAFLGSDASAQAVTDPHVSPFILFTTRFPQPCLPFHSPSAISGSPAALRPSLADLQAAAPRALFKPRGMQVERRELATPPP